MMKFNYQLRSLLVVGIIVLFATTGCVSNKKYNRDINALQSQVSTLSGEVARLDSQQSAKPSFFGGSKPTHETTERRGSSVIYRTPSGFEIPAVDIQRALKGAGYFDGDVDGEIGSKTREAVRKFQQDNGLHADGVVGKKTWDNLQTHLTSSSSAIK